MGADNPLNSIEGEIEKQPWYVWAGALGTAAVVLVYVVKQRAKVAATQTATTSATDTSTPTAADNTALTNGYQVADMAGLPYGYTSTSGLPVDNYPSSNGDLGGTTSTGTTSTTTPTTTTTPTPTPVTPAPVITPITPQPIAQTPLQQAGLIRPRFNSNTTMAYDKKVAQGVPIHSQPSNTSPIVGYASYASQVKITGTPVGGGSNFGKGNTSGSGLWFPVSNGYISGYDIVGFFTLPSAAAHGGGGLSSPFQSFLNMGRNTVDQHVQNMGIGNE